MKITVVTEKPAVSRCIAPLFKEHWPNERITFVHSVPYANFKFSYPRGLKWSDFPRISDPRHKISAWDSWSCPPLEMGEDGALSPIEMSDGLFLDADLIVDASDPWHGGATSFDLMLTAAMGVHPVGIPRIPLFGLDDESIRGGLRKMNDESLNSTFERLKEYGYVKKYFDWNWNVNSLVILSETARRAGVPSDAPPISKYALQTLFALKDGGAISEGAVMKKMATWKGTGRYKPEKGRGEFGLGSCASRSAILENLKKADLLTSNLGLMKISPTGLRFLEYLHPDCSDPDLPFRLHVWCSNGLKTSKPALDRYVKTFFGKQKRFLEDISKRGSDEA